MSLPEMLLIGVALSMDAFAVTVSDSLVYRSERLSKLIWLPVAFGFFQGAMPALGYALSGLFAQLIETYAPIVTLVILGVIGSNMLIEGIRELRSDTAEKSCDLETKALTLSIIFFQAIATAIDAFAVGVSLRAQAVNLPVCVVLIGLTTFVLSCIALRVGKRFGTLLGDRAQIVGGMVLIGIGLKALFM